MTLKKPSSGKYQILNSSRNAIGEAVVLGKYTSYFLFKDITFTKTVETKRFLKNFGKRLSKIN